MTAIVEDISEIIKSEDFFEIAQVPPGMKVLSFFRTEGEGTMNFLVKDEEQGGPLVVQAPEKQFLQALGFEEHVVLNEFEVDPQKGRVKMVMFDPHQKRIKRCTVVNLPKAPKL